jgi:hypothetical protein
MVPIKPIDKIAMRFNLSTESAKYYLGRIQRAFKVEKPSHKVIMDFIEMLDIKRLPKAQSLAILLNESGSWPYELATKPVPDAEAGTDSFEQTGHEINRNIHTSRRKKSGNEKLNLCPHGIPRNKVCADCEFETFKKLIERE